MEMQLFRAKKAALNSFAKALKTQKCSEDAEDTWNSPDLTKAVMNIYLFIIFPIFNVLDGILLTSPQK